MIISDGLIVWVCHSCGGTPKTIGFDLHSVRYWKNQHGQRVRFFCHRCGHVHDVTELKGKVTVEKHTMRCAVYTHADELPF